MKKSLLKSLSLFLLIEISIVSYVVIFQKNLVYPGPKSISTSTPMDYGKTYEDIRIDVNGENNFIHAWWLPQKTNSSLQPSLLYLHGNGSSLGQLSNVASIFYDYGWNVLLFDYRNYGKSSGASEGISEESTNTDSLAAYSWLKNKGLSDNNIILWGHSLGSAVAAKLATIINPAGVILEGAFTSIYDMSRYKYWYLPLFPFMVRDKYNTIEKVKNIRAPLLMLHAEHDKVVPFSLGQKVFENANPPKQWITIEGVNHNDFPSVHKMYQERIKAFVHEAINNNTTTTYKPQP